MKDKFAGVLRKRTGTGCGAEAAGRQHQGRLRGRLRGRSLLLEAPAAGGGPRVCGSAGSCGEKTHRRVR